MNDIGTLRLYVDEAGQLRIQMWVTTRPVYGVRRIGSRRVFWTWPLTK